VFCPSLPTVNFSSAPKFLVGTMTIAVTKGCGAEGTAPVGSSRICVIVVGCGYGGIAAAIECHRKGHKVVVFEKNQEVGGLGM
jgi:ribulose 1,5-bisphosphate synthetase/thiazole synthase